MSENLVNVVVESFFVQFCCCCCFVLYFDTTAIQLSGHVRSPGTVVINGEYIIIMNQQFSRQPNAKNKVDLKAKDGAIATVS